MENWGTLWGMGSLRIAFGVMSLLGGLLMLRGASVESAMRINGVLGAVGPLVFVAVSVLGGLELASRASWGNLSLVVVGVVLILWGTR